MAENRCLTEGSRELLLSYPEECIDCRHLGHTKACRQCLAELSVAVAKAGPSEDPRVRILRDGMFSGWASSDREVEERRAEAARNKLGELDLADPLRRFIRNPASDGDPESPDAVLLGQVVSRANQSMPSLEWFTFITVEQAVALVAAIREVFDV